MKPSVDTDEVRELGESLESVGARGAVDPEANNTRPCFGCGTRTAPRQLVVVAAYLLPIGRRCHPGDPIRRPMCAACRAPLAASAAAAETSAPSERVREIRLVLVGDELRDFTRCARVAGVDLEDWIIQCAAVQAASAIDALQTEARRRRLARGSDNAEKNAKHRRQREIRRAAGGKP